MHPPIHILMADIPRICPAWHTGNRDIAVRVESGRSTLASSPAPSMSKRTVMAESSLLFACGERPPIHVHEAKEIGIVAQSNLIVGRDGGGSGLLWGRSVWTFGDTVSNRRRSDRSFRPAPRIRPCCSRKASRHLDRRQ